MGVYKQFGSNSMNAYKVLIYAIVSFLFSSVLLTASYALAGEEAPVDTSATPPEISGELYLPSADPVAAVASVIEAARKSNKLALVIMGANWCHDSRGLASRFHQEPMKTLIDQHYETIFVDVGYLSKGRDVIEGLGLPVYYATPTVLIIDPLSGQLVNADNRHQWADAFSISMDDTVAYFRQMAATDLEPLRAGVGADPREMALFEEIDTFEQQQADRLHHAYAVLGPMLKEYKEGDKAAFSEEKWNEVRDFRYKVPYDVEALKMQARDRVAAGDAEIELDYPEYPAFSWDEDAQ